MDKEVDNNEEVKKIPDEDLEELILVKKKYRKAYNHLTYNEVN
jgi:hypothetical protein